LSSLLVLLAPRQVNVGSVVGSRVRPANGMTAGLKRANFFARLLLFKTLETLHAAIPRAGPRQYVDDLAQLIWGTRQEVIELAVRSAWMLQLALKQMKVKISVKSVIVGSTIGIAREISDALFKKCGLRLEAVKQGVDLGIDCGGRMRATQKMHERERRPTVSC